MNDISTNNSNEKNENNFKFDYFELKRILLKVAVATAVCSSLHIVSRQFAKYILPNIFEKPKQLLYFSELLVRLKRDFYFVLKILNVIKYLF